MAFDTTTEDTLFDLWQAGVDLDAAWLNFSPTVEHFDLVALRTHPANEDALVAHPRYDAIKDWLPRGWEERQLKHKLTVENLRHYLLDCLCAGDLWAIGCRTDDGGNDYLERVPRNLFFSDEDLTPPVYPVISWTKGAIHGQSQSYFNIRVVEPPAGSRQVAEVALSASKKRPRTGGRPNTRKNIESTAMTLLKDPEFRSKKRWDQAVTVRVEICGPSSSDKHDRPGYKTETIVRILGEIDKPQNET